MFNICYSCPGLNIAIIACWLCEGNKMNLLYRPPTRTRYKYHGIYLKFFYVSVYLYKYVVCTMQSYVLLYENHGFLLGGAWKTAKPVVRYSVSLVLELTEVLRLLQVTPLLSAVLIVITTDPSRHHLKQNGLQQKSNLSIILWCKSVLVVWSSCCFEHIKLNSLLGYLMKNVIDIGLAFVLVACGQ